MRLVALSRCIQTTVSSGMLCASMKATSSPTVNAGVASTSVVI